MERCTMLVDWKNQYCQYDYTTQGNLWIQCSSYQIANGIFHRKVKGKSFSRVWLFGTPWTVAYHTPLSMGFSRQEYWSGLPLPSPEPGQKIFKLLWKHKRLNSKSNLEKENRIGGTRLPLEWVAMPFSRGSSWPRDRTHISSVSCIGRWVLYH